MDKEQSIVTSNPSSNGTNEGKLADGGTASSPARPTEGYKVGPGRPPKEHQFKPGQSGNPKGAKRKPRSLAPDLKRLFEQALSETVAVKQGERGLTLTMAEAGIKQLVAQFAKGDRHARRDVIAYAEKLGIDLMASHREAIEGALALDHQAILDGYVTRQVEALTPPSSSPVFAPPELLDDDITNKDSRA
jgi:Family of unknown function (DUF5681)